MAASKIAAPTVEEARSSGAKGLLLGPLNQAVVGAIQLAQQTVSSAQLPRGVGAMNDSGCCCCCSSPDPVPVTPEERARAAMQLEQAKAAKRQEMTRIARLPPDQLQAETKAHLAQERVEACLGVAACLLVLGAIFAVGDSFFV